MDLTNYRENPSEFSPQKHSCNVNLCEGGSSSEPLDFSTRRERVPTPENRNPWTTSPESGVSSLGAGSPLRLSPEREISPRAPANIFSLFANQPPRHERPPEGKMEESRAAIGGFGACSSVKSQGVGTPGMETGFNPPVSPQLPTILAHLQQANPLILSTLCNLASQRVAEMTGPSVRPMSIPHMQAPHIPQVPPMPFMGFQMPPGPMPTLAPIGSPKFPLGLDLEDENLTAKSNESYLKFRAEMLAKGQIGPKTRRAHGRNGHPREGTNGAGGGGSSSSSGTCSDDNSSEKGEDRGKGGHPGSKELAKDDAYWERRRKNNEAAKRSRDARRAKEDEIAVRAAFLETENMQLRMQVNELKRNIRQLYAIQNAS